MAYLQVDSEGSTKSMHVASRSENCRFPNIIIHTDPGSLIISGLELAKSNGNKPDESFLSESFDSSVDSPLDPEIQKIKSITKALNSGLRSQLKTYKGFTSKYTSQNEELNNQLKDYKEEIEGVKTSVQEMLIETTHTQEFLRSLRNSTSEKMSRDDLATSNGAHQTDLAEVIKKLNKEIEEIKERAIFQQNEMKKIDTSKPLVIEDTPKSSSCRCYIF